MNNKPILAYLLGVFVSCCLSSNTYADQRIVTIGGTLTEIAFLLGSGQQLVASDTSSIYPEQANHMPKVGYQRTLSVEGVLSVQPDILLITPAAGPAKVLQQLADNGIQLITVQAPDSQQGILEKIEQVAKALDKEERGAQVITQLKQDFAALSTPNAWLTHRQPRLLFVLQVGGTPIVAGNHTGPDALIQIAGASNAVEGVNGYKPLTPEAILLAQPDAILVTQQGLTRAGENSLWSLPGMAATPAGKNRRLIALDALLALGLGPRTPEAAEYLQQQLSDWQP